MKKNIITVLFILITIAINAQQAKYYSYTLVQNTPLRAQIYFQEFSNAGDKTDLDLNNYIYEKILAKTQQKYGPTKKANNANVWLLEPLFSITNNKNEADVIISGTYSLKKEHTSEEKLQHETSSNFGTPIPYFEQKTTNKVQIQILFQYEYKDQSILLDTLTVSQINQKSPGKKFKTIKELEEKCFNDLNMAFYKKFDLIKRKAHYYKLPKVKVKNKALKAEYKTASDLLENAEIIKLGKLYQRIYNTEPSKEAAYCLGACYELIGNIPKAQEYYNQMPDFHTKTRIKNTRKLYDYLLEIDLSLQNVVFE